ncbi:unnamed protein product [Adineta steineri]|uniref:Uncharacterized protein n=1 Tax=Adineta steineri TaxID=433720 RepID=A0A815TUV7_9BILA|nr:unnamed protein product [Adineta steineri]
MDNASICEIHRNILLQKLYLKNGDKCDVCLSVRGLTPRAMAGLRYINVCQAITLFEIFQLKNCYGRLICRRCRGEVSSKANLGREKLHKEAFECLFDDESICSEENPMEDKDLDYQPPFDVSIGEEKVKEQITALNSFLAACDSKSKVNVTTSYKNLSHRVKLRYVRLVKFVMRSVTSLIASDDSNLLIHDCFSDVSTEEMNIVLDGNFR